MGVGVGGGGRCVEFFPTDQTKGPAAEIGPFATVASYDHIDKHKLHYTTLQNENCSVVSITNATKHTIFVVSRSGIHLLHNIQKEKATD